MKNKGFTLVELIVVITILSILGTIGFISLQGFSRDARDSSRIADLKSIEEGLQILLTKGKSLPKPYNSVDITASGTVISYQGYAGKKVMGAVKVHGGGYDPLDQTFYTYSTDTKFKNYQLLGFLENGEQIALNTNILNQTNAIDYSTRFPKLLGKPLGIIVDPTTKEPIQTTGTGVDIVNTNTEYKVYLNKYESITGTGASLVSIIGSGKNYGYCKDLLDNFPFLYGINQIYYSNFNGYDNKKIYCDMTTDGGGWTYATMLADTTTKNFFRTGNTNKITSLTENISSKGQISDIWRDNNDKDIFIKCVTDNDLLQNYRIPLIFYDYKKSDINLLETNDKAGNNFSSEDLNVSWDGNNYVMKNVYGNSGSNQTMYLSSLLSGNIFTSVGSTNIVGKNYYYLYSPTYSTSAYVSEYLGLTTYCMTAIR